MDPEFAEQWKQLGEALGSKPERTKPKRKPLTPIETWWKLHQEFESWAKRVDKAKLKPFTHNLRSLLVWQVSAWVREHDKD
jgi:hypothetical protein